MPTSLLSKVKSQFGFGSLIDPRNQDSELSPIDFKLPAPAPTETDEQVTALIRSRAKSSRSSRSEVDEQVILSLAFDMGKQWYDYTRDSRRLQCLYDEDSDDKYWFMTDNQIHPLVVTNTVRATQTRPDTYVAPLTESKQDKLAAEEANAVTAHLARLWDRQAQVREWANMALTTTTAFLQCVINYDAEVEIPTGVNPDGTIAGTHLVKAGEIHEELVLGTDILVDPKATVFQDALWIIHEKVVSLSYLQEKYPEKGKYVQATVNYDDYSTVEMRIASISNSQPTSRQADKNATILYTMWEKPCPKYENGRYVVAASNVILEKTDWPYEWRGRDGTLQFPYIPLYYQPVIKSIWGRNMVWDMIPHQRAINKILSNIVGRATTDKMQILVQRSSEGADGTQLPIDAYTNRRNYGILPFTGMKPEIMPTTAPPAYHFQTLEMLAAKMENIAGAHDVGNGNLPDNGGAGLSGVSINLLQQADMTKIAIFVGNIESALEQLMECELSHARQLYVGSGIMRLVGLDDEAVPGKAVAKAMAFENLGKGSTRVVITPGSGMPKTPEAQQEQLDKMFTMGAFGDPKTPGAVETYLEESITVRTDTIKERVVERMKAQAAQNPTPEQAQLMAEQQRAKAQAEAAHMEQIHEASIEHAKAETMALQAKLKSEGETQAENLKMAHEIAKLHAQNEADIAKLRAQSEIKVAEMQAQAIMDVHKERLLRGLPPSISPISVSADPTATVEIEKMAGVEGKVPPTPKPATGSKPVKKGATNG